VNRFKNKIKKKI